MPRRRRSSREQPDSALPAVARKAELDKTYESGHEARRHSIGRKASPARLEDYIYRRYRELARKREREAHIGRGRLPAEVKAELKAQAAQLVKSEARLSEAEQRLQDEWEADTKRAPERTSELPVINAVLSLPHIGWMMLRLACKTGRRGIAPRRRLVAACIMHMAFGKRRPEIWATANEFTGAQALLNWTYAYPNDPGAERRPDRETFYKAVHEALHPDHIDPTLAEHIEVETFKQFATQAVTDAHGNPKTDRHGRPVLKHPKAGLALAVDGSFTQGQVADTVPFLDDDGEHLAMLTHYREDLSGIRYRTYGRNRFNADGSLNRDARSFVSKVLGYKLVALVDVATARCVISTLVPADAHEPEVAIYLLERLYELWPECPAEFLVGDALYAHGFDFLRAVLFRFGLDPVFPWHGKYVEDETKTKKGVPLCHCLGEPRPMRFKQRKGKWWGHKQRVEGGLAHGQWAPEEDISLRYEFVCPDGNPTCKNKTTRAWEHPGMNTFLPHTGDSRNAMLRRVLLRQRNVVESFYSWMQEHGKQGKGMERPDWANDVEVHWLLALTATFYTAQALVFENEAYERALAEGQDLRLLDDVGRAVPAPGPTAEELAAATRERNRVVGLPVPPPSWVAQCNNQPEPLTGSAAVWLSEFRAGIDDEAAVAA